MVMDASFCLSCKRKDECRRVCKRVEKYVRTQGIYDKDWIRPKVSSRKRHKYGSWRETPFTMLGWDTNGEGQVKED